MTITYTLPTELLAIAGALIAITAIVAIVRLLQGDSKGALVGIVILIILLILFGDGLAGGPISTAVASKSAETIQNLW